MFTEGYSFPHPVLGNEDDISGEFNVAFEVVRNQDRKIAFENIIVEVTNEYVKKLIDEGNAITLIKIYCSSTLTTWIYKAANRFEINEDDVVNKIEVQVFIVTKSAITNYSDSTFNPQYGGEIFSLDKNEIIGISGKTTLEYQVKLLLQSLK